MGTASASGGQNLPERGDPYIGPERSRGSATVRQLRPSAPVDSWYLTDAWIRAAVHAALAPSIYNTQPWLMRLGPARLQLNADPDRWLVALDRQGRQLTLSVGCALFNARSAMAAAELRVVVDRVTGSVPARLSATLTGRNHDPDPEDVARADLNDLVNRRPTTSTAVPVGDTLLLQHLHHASRAEGTVFVPLATPAHRELLTSLGRQSRSEAAASGCVDRAQTWARAFGPTIWSWDVTRFDGTVMPAVICTEGDAPLDWLLAGESLQRVLLELSRFGYTAQIYPAPIEISRLRSRLREALPIAGIPQVLVIIGPAVVPPTQPRRRLLRDVLRSETEPREHSPAECSALPRR